MKKNKIGSWLCHDLQAMSSCAILLLSQLRKGKVLIEGPLGAGKTTLVQYFSKALGCSELMTSPTYTLINLHANNKIAHLDLYRVDNALELEVLGLEELDCDWYFIEWGERFETYLQPLSALITIEPLSNGGREIKLYSYAS